MRVLGAIFLCVGLAACSEPAPKTGAMPGVATGGYDAPSNAEAAAAYMAGFQARYDIPELDYPEDIKLRIRQAKQKRFARDMAVAEKRQKIMSRLALTVLAQKDPEAKELLEKLKNDPKAKPDTKDVTQIFAMFDRAPQRVSLSKEWAYYGKFRGVEITPRLQGLNQNLLKDPEGTIMRQSTMDSIAQAFN